MVLTWIRVVAKRAEQKAWLNYFNQELKIFFASRMGCPKYSDEEAKGNKAVVSE